MGNKADEAKDAIDELLNEKESEIEDLQSELDDMTSERDNLQENYPYSTWRDDCLHNKERIMLFRFFG